MSIQKLSIEERFQRFNKYSTIAVAVSGGADSTALMYMLCEWQKSLKQRNKQPPQIHILTVDHALRPEAAHETQWVAALASKLQLQCAILKWQGDTPTSSIQEKARENRYNLLIDWCQTNKVPALLTAHHQDDQAETIVMRLARGSGVDGLSAMFEQKQLENIQLYRPLLDVPKSALLEYLSSIQADYIEDPSNENLDYERVRIRKSLPLLKELGMTSEQLGQSAKRLQRARSALEYYTAQSWEKLATQYPAGYMTLNFSEFSDLPEEIALRIFSCAIKHIGGCSTPHQAMSKAEKALYNLIQEKAQKITLSGCLIQRKENTLLFVRELRGQNINEQKLIPGSSLQWDNRFDIRLSSEAPSELSIRFLTEEGYLSLPLEKIKKDIENPILLSREVRASLPSIWSKDEILYVPHLSFCNESFNAKHIQIQYVTEPGALFSSAPIALYPM